MQFKIAVLVTNQRISLSNYPKAYRMKLSIEREEEEKRGIFGTRTEYRSHISLVLTEPEEETARELGFMRATLIGGTQQLEEVRLLALVGSPVSSGKLTLDDLVVGSGITARAGSDNLLKELSIFETLLKDRCTSLKNRLHTHIQSKQAFSGGKHYEEEL